MADYTPPSAEELNTLWNKLEADGVGSDEEAIQLLAHGYVEKLLRVDGDDGDAVQTVRWVLGDPRRTERYWDVFHCMNGEEKFYKCRMIPDGLHKEATDDMKGTWKDHLALCK